MNATQQLTASFIGRALHGLGLALATGIAISVIGPMVYLAIMSPSIFRAAAGWHAALVAGSVWLFAVTLFVCPIWAWIKFFRGQGWRAWYPIIGCAACGVLFLSLWGSVDARGAKSLSTPTVDRRD